MSYWCRTMAHKDICHWFWEVNLIHAELDEWTHGGWGKIETHWEQRCSGEENESTPSYLMAWAVSSPSLSQSMVVLPVWEFCEISWFFIMDALSQYGSIRFIFIVMKSYLRQSPRICSSELVEGKETKYWNEL